jgi:ribonucleoside-diphosphate reductase alpha chain
MQQVYTHEETYKASLEYFQGDELAAKVFVDKYALKNKEGEFLEKTPDDMHRRIAKELSRIEAGRFHSPLPFETIYGLLRNFEKIVPQGSPMFGIGNYEQFSTLSNCYVVASPLDSYGDIFRADEQLAQISKRRGGVGLDLSNLRPNMSKTNNAARNSTGVVSFAKRYSNTIREVGQDGRRGALMLTLSVHHPDIIEFASSKTKSDQVTGANISIRLTDEFLNAVLQDDVYEQRWPVEGSNPKISKMVSAKSVWKKIIELAHATAEPGLLFWDNIKRESPADCYASYQTISTNPCSELPLSADDSCRLLLINLFSYVCNPFTKETYFNFDAFYADCQVAQRLMDDIVELELEAIDRIIAKIESDPEPDEVKDRELYLWISIRQACFSGRRTGTGITALGDTIAALGIRYGTDESIEVTDKIYKTLKLGCYRASVDMAKELGPFPAWDYELEKNNPFLLRIGDEDPILYEDMKTYGRRNIALLTTAPAGTVSIETRTSSGCEPIFMIAYKRRKKINPSDQHARVDFVDQSGDKWEEFTVYHPKVKTWMEVTGLTDLTQSPYHLATAEEIDWEQRVKLQAVANRHVDHAISSTINLPEEVTVEKVAEIYEAAWKSGCKGITVYRKNCRTGVLIEKPTLQPENKIVKTHAIKRPKVLDCDIYNTMSGGKRYFVVVGLLGKDPYEVIAGTHAFSPRSEHGEVVKIRQGVYQLQTKEGEALCDNIAEHCSDDQEAMLRMVSASLRHGCEIRFVVEQLEKVRGSLQTFAKALGRVLKKYIPDGTKVSDACPECSQETLQRQNGCVTCVNCGFSKCS